MSNAFQLTTTLKYFHPIKPTRKPRSRPRSVRSSNPRRLRHVRNDSKCTHTRTHSRRHYDTSHHHRGALEAKNTGEREFGSESRARGTTTTSVEPLICIETFIFFLAHKYADGARALPPSRWIAFYIFAARGEVKGRDEWLRGCTYIWYVEANL